MKNNKFITGCALTLASVLSMQTAFAYDSFLYKSNDRLVSVHCETDIPDSPFANILVLPFGVNREGISDNSFDSEKSVFKMVHTTGGKISETIKLEQDFEKGEYILYAECASFEDKSIFVVSDSTLSRAVSDVNSGKSLSDVSFGANEEFFAENKDCINLLIKNAMPSGGYTNDSFAEEYMRASAVAHMIKNDIALKEIADLYESYFSSGAEQLKDMTDADTEAFLSVAAEYDIGNCSAQEVIKGILFVADAKSQTEQNKLIETVHKYISDNKLSKGKYERLNTLNASKVRSQLMDSVASLNSAEKIYDKYIEICDKLYDEQSDNQSSGGGGGGSSSGSKGSGGGVSLPAVSTPIAGTASSYTGSFADMTGHWSEAYVKECVTAGIINGYADNTFRPDAKITRAETTALIYKLFGLKSGNCNFADVSSDDWYFECVGAAYSSGIINGYSDGTFRPSDNISRQDIAVMLCRAVESAGYVFDGKTSFADGDSISAYASDSVSKLAAKGIITGDNGLFRPMDYLTRGEAAALVCRIKNIVYGGQR